MSRSRCRTSPLSLFLLLFLVITPELSLAQSQATTGIIRGRVLDPTGQPVPGAEVRVHHLETGLERTVVAGGTGTFLATLLPVGEYEVTGSSVQFLDDIRREGVILRLGETVDLNLQFEAVRLEGVEVTGEAPLVDPNTTTSATRLDREIVDGLPNNGRDFIDFSLLTPGVGIVQGPDGEELTIGGQRGIFNNVTVDGADFNNPFFGEQRGGQRPAFTFNQDAVEEIVVVNQGATAEFGRSAGGFVNVITKSGTNDYEGTLHYFGQADELSSDFARGGGNPDFSQQQFGLTFGGPIVRDKAFFFLAYDQQEFEQTKQVNRLPAVTDTEGFNRLRTWMDTAFDGALAGDFGPITRTDDAKALMLKLDWNLNSNNRASLKYNFTESEQVNGTFDFDVWGRSANGLEKDNSHAVNGALFSQINQTVSNEFRFQWAREERPRPYEGPTFPGTDRHFPDTGMGFADGFRFGMPFFLPIEDFDERIQILNNVSILEGDHHIKIGGEWNRTKTEQTFVGFANGRFIFNSVDGFLNYVENGPTYVECSDGSSSLNGTCPEGTDITGPLLLFLQFAPVPPLETAEQAGTQEIVQNELAFFIQDTWKPNRRWTLNYGVRWEAQIQPDPITPPDEVFFSDFIGQTRNGQEFPSDGKIPSDYGMIQPRVGIAYDPGGDGRQVFRANAGLYYARIPGLVLASPRSTNGSVGQTIFRASFFNGFGVTPPAYDELVDTEGLTPQNPDVFVFDKDFRNPRTLGVTGGYERFLTDNIAGSFQYQYSHTDRLFRFVNRNGSEFGNPWSEGLGADGSNGIGALTTAESNAESTYHGLTWGLRGHFMERAVEFQANYTLSFDKSDDDNERDPFTFRYVDGTRLDREYNWSDRDQRHRFNALALVRLPYGLEWNNRVSYYSAQPVSEVCGPGNVGTGERATVTFGLNSDRVCPDGSILERNTLRKDNEFFTWDVRVSKAFPANRGAEVELIFEVFNLFDTDNFQDPSAVDPLFNFDGTIRSGLGDPRRIQLGAKYRF